MDDREQAPRFVQAGLAPFRRRGGGRGRGRSAVCRATPCGGGGFRGGAARTWSSRRNRASRPPRAARVVCDGSSSWCDTFLRMSDAAAAIDPRFPGLRREVVEGYLQAPAHMVAEVLDGELFVMSRPRREP